MKSSSLLIFPLSLVVSVLFFSYLVKPEWDKYSNNKLELKKETERLGNIKSNKSKFDQMLVSYNNLEFEQKKVIEEAVPDNISEEKFLNYLVSIISEIGLEVELVDFVKETFTINEQIPEVLKNQVKIKLKGNFSQVKRSIYLLESLDRLVKVENISINQEINTERLSVGLDLLIFNKKDNSIAKIDSTDKYFTKILEEGLNTNLIEEYIKYRNELNHSEIKWNGDIGKENLFDNNQIPEEIVNLEEQQEQQENLDGDVATENSPEEDLNSDNSNLQ